MPRFPKIVPVALVLGVALAAGWWLASRFLTPRASAGSVPSADDPEITLRYTPTAVGSPVADFVRPLVTNVQVVDLDQDGLQDILYCEAQKNSVRWIRQSPRGTFTEQVIADAIPGPAHVWAADVNGKGRLDVLVASMGKILPTNERIGAIVVLENLDNRRFQKRVLAEQMARVTDIRAADLVGHGDGRLDLIVGQFGYDQGETRWLENKGNWQFEGHIINTQSGCIHTPVADFDGDGRLDIAALITQEWEEVHVLRNLGNGQFKDNVVWGSTNEQYGGSGMTLTDLNRDGKPDLVFTNGDALDYSGLGVRPWFGLQWLENHGDGTFQFHRIGDMPGAFGPNAADLNGDGAVDLVTVSPFADWTKPDAISLMAWINDGRQGFTPVVLAHTPTHLITAAVGDLDGNGVPEIVTGGFHAFPPWEHMSNITLWRRQ